MPRGLAAAGVKVFEGLLAAEFVMSERNDLLMGGTLLSLMVPRMVRLAGSLVFASWPRKESEVIDGWFSPS